MQIKAIMGRLHARKGSTVRALTGASQANNAWQIGRAGESDLCVAVFIASLNEGDRSIQKILLEFKDLNVDEVLICLRIDASGSYPAGIEYLKAFTEAGYPIADVVVLGEERLDDWPPDLPEPFFIPEARTLPTNSIAAKIRLRWGWL